MSGRDGLGHQDRDLGDRQRYNAIRRATNAGVLDHRIGGSTHFENISDRTDRYDASPGPDRRSATPVSMDTLMPSHFVCIVNARQWQSKFARLMRKFAPTRLTYRSSC